MTRYPRSGPATYVAAPIIKQGLEPNIGTKKIPTKLNTLK